MIRRVLRTILEGVGYEVAEAENGQEALARCQVAMPNLIVVDWNMPVMSGIDFITALRGLDVETPPHLVFCTTNGDEDAIEKGIDAGADAYVIKPFDQDVFRETLVKIGAA